MLTILKKRDSLKDGGGVGGTAESVQKGYTKRKTGNK